MDWLMPVLAMNSMASRVLLLSKRMKWRNCRQQASERAGVKEPASTTATHPTQLLGVDAQAHVVHARLAERLVLLQDLRHLTHGEVVRGRARSFALVARVLLLEEDDLGQRPTDVQAEALPQVGPAGRSCSPE
jgi:hypothetical protein